MFFSSKNENCDDNPLYHVYNNLIGYFYNIVDFTNKNDNSLESFNKFLWDNGHKFLLFNQATFFSMLPIDNKKKIYNTTLIICKNKHIYLIKYIYNQYICFNSNECSPFTFNIREVIDEVINADYFFIDITDTLYNEIVPKINRLYNKNDYYKSQCAIFAHYLKRWSNDIKNKDETINLYK
jgi:hypothetical protein